MDENIESDSEEVASGVKPPIFRKNISDSEKQAFMTLRKEAEEGSEEALLHLSIYYKYGHIVKQSNELGLHYCRIAAEHGNLKAILTIGENYEVGDWGLEQSTHKAMKYYQMASDRGHAQGSFHIAHCYRWGIGVEKSLEKAIEYYQLAIEQGLNQDIIVKDIESDKEYERNPQEAFYCFQIATDRGHAYGPFCIARCYRWGIGVEKSQKKAIEYFTLALARDYKKDEILSCIESCKRLLEGRVKQEKSEYARLPSDQKLAKFHDNIKVFEEVKRQQPAKPIYGVVEDADAVSKSSNSLSTNFSENSVDADTSYQLAQKYEQEQNKKEAIKHYTEAAQQGHPEALYMLGNFYKDGFGGLKQSFEKAVEYYKLAADQGYPKAQNNLGICYELGLGGLIQSYSKAIENYQAAADQGNPDAQHRLGWCFLKGLGWLPESVDKAVEYFALAASQGQQVAQNDLGCSFARGVGGLPQSLEKAVEYYKLAADQGESTAQFNLAYCYQYGEGVEKSVDDAIKYYKLSADQGNSNAQYSLGAIYEKIGLMEEAMKYYQKSAKQYHPKALGLFGIIGISHQKVDIEPYIHDNNCDTLKKILMETEPGTTFLDLTNFSLDEALVVRDVMIENPQLFFLCPEQDAEKIYLSFELGGYDRSSLKIYPVVNPSNEEEFYGFTFIGQKKVA